MLEETTKTFLTRLQCRFPQCQAIQHAIEPTGEPCRLVITRQNDSRSSLPGNYGIRHLLDRSETPRQVSTRQDGNQEAEHSADQRKYPSNALHLGHFAAQIRPVYAEPHPADRSARQGDGSDDLIQGCCPD